jgi:hypothetical protein
VFVVEIEIVSGDLARQLLFTNGSESLVALTEIGSENPQA